MSKKQAGHGQPGVYNATPPTFVDGEFGGLQLTSKGDLKTASSSVALSYDNQFQKAITSADASSATQIQAKVASQTIYLSSVVISVDTAMSVQLQDDSGTPVVLMEQIYMPANSVAQLFFDPPLAATENQDLDVITSTSGNISVLAIGFQQ